MTFTTPELQHLLTLLGYDTGKSPIRPGNGLTGEGVLSLRDKVRAEYEAKNKSSIPVDMGGVSR